MIGNFIGAPVGGAVNTSGTLYSQAVSIAAAGSLVLLRTTGKHASLIATGTVSLARSIAHALGITGPTSITARKTVSHQGPSISGTGTATVSFTKRIQQAIAVATAGILSVSFHAGRVVMLHMTAMGSVTFGKAISKTLAAITVTATVQALKSALKSISATSAASILIELTKALYAPLTHLASASRSLGAALFGGSTRLGSTSAGGATLVARSSGTALGNARAAGGKASNAKSGGEQN